MIRLIDAKKDLDMVYEIENLCFTDARYNLDQLLYEVNNELSKFYVYELDNKIVGFLIYWITFNSATVVQVATHPNYQHKGIATSLIDEMFKQLNSLGYGEIETVTLEVRSKNEIAHKFYLKSGFKDILLKKKYYSNGDDAYYMTRILL